MYTSSYQHTLAHEIAAQHEIAWSLAGLGFVAQAQGQPERATRLLGAAKPWFDVTGSLTNAGDQAEFDRSVAAARAQLSEDAFAAAWAAGRAQSLEQAIEEALRSGN